MDVGGWLRNLGLEQYEAAFRDNEIDDKVLPDLTAEDLKEVGVAVVGHRRTLLTAIAKLAGSSAMPATATMHSSAAAPRTAEDVAERRQLTVMFCDLVGSTALSTRLDPEDMRSVIRAYQDACSGVVARYDGFVAKFMGDGVLAYFGYPRAHEDDAERAVRAGLEIAAAVGALETRARERLSARLGIATGLVVVGDLIGASFSQEQAVVGETPNLAARLQALARPDEIVVAGATRRLLGELFRFRDLGRQTAKGFAEPVEAWAVDGVAAAESRFEAAHRSLTGFVGREAEGATLRERLRRAWGGEGQIVLISGEAGIGKSRLAAWLAAHVADAPHTRLRYQCSPYHRDSVLHPFVAAIERGAGIAVEDPGEAKLAKLEAALPVQAAETVPLFAALLSIPTGSRYPPLALSPAQQRRLTQAALLDQLEALARERPVLMLFEDVHWADATSLEVLDLTVERVRTLPVLVLIIFRPEYEAPWAGLPHATSLALTRLDRAEVEILAERVAGGRTLPPEVMGQIVAKTDGVPLFVEELTKTVLESGLLTEGPQGWRLDGPLPPLAIPATLQDSLMARLDRLAPVKEIAQIGAAIGREFSYALLSAVAGRDEAALRGALVQLEEAELLFHAGTPPDARYSFKHALVQDTAYESLLKSRRQLLHRRIAEALRDQFPGLAAAEPEVVAHHLAHAGLDELAIEWWGKAGDQALRRSAFKEAAAHLGKAIQLADKVAGGAPPSGDRLRRQTSYGQALIWAKGYHAPETSAAFTRARQLAAGVADPPERFKIYYGLWVGHETRGEPAPMRELAQLFLAEAEGRPEAPIAHHIAGATAWYLGDYPAAHAHQQRTIEVYDRARDRDLADAFGHDPLAAAEVSDALVLWTLGRVDEASRLAERALADATATGHMPTTIFVRTYRALLGLQRGDPQAVAAEAEAMGEILSRYDLPALWTGSATFYRGWAAWRRGGGTTALADLHRGIAIREAEGHFLNAAVNAAALAEAEADAGEIAAALKRLDEAIADLPRTDRRWYEAELHRFRGELLLKHPPGDTARAEDAFLTAIAVAQAQQARSFELRAALGLAQLYRAARRDADAYAVLAPSLEGFSPTREFPEIAEAQTLLAALGETDEVKNAAASRQRRLQLQTAYGNALMQARGMHSLETREAFSRARKLAGGIGDPSERFSSYYGLWVGAYVRNEKATMTEAAEALLKESESRPNSAEAGIAQRIYGTTCWVTGGDVVVAGEHLERAVALYHPQRDHELAYRFAQDVGVSARVYLSLVRWVLGECDRSRALMSEALGLAVKLNHVPTIVYIHFHAAWLEMIRFDPARAKPRAEAALALAREHGMKLWTLLAPQIIGWANAHSPQPPGDCKEMCRTIAEANAQGVRWGDHVGRPLLAACQADAGQVEMALATVDQAATEALQSGIRYFDAEIHRIRGEILLKRDPANTGPAEDCFLSAIAVAQRQKAKCFELRAALSLAKLYQSIGRAADGHALLTPALAGFSPTPEFPEIEQAQALLAALER